MEERMQQQLDRRRQEGTLRTLLPLNELLKTNNESSTMDFSSNDYLGLARCPCQIEKVQHAHEQWMKTNHIHTPGPVLGATGSRLLSGDSYLARTLELELARIHNRPACLITNSGYDANLSVLSSILLQQDVVIMDELVHNSLIMGVRMSRGALLEHQVKTFRHNDVSSLRQVLEQTLSTNPQILVVVESVYSMDGDVAPLTEILDLALEFNDAAKVIVDEAHGLGIYGRTNVQDLPETTSTTMQSHQQQQERPSSRAVVGGTGVLAALELESHPALLCSIHTFGKAAGCHGAVICGSHVLKEYLINYARPIVYSTALPSHSLVSIQCAYASMMCRDDLRTRVFELVRQFQREMQTALSTSSNNNNSISLWPSPSPIQALVVPGNETCVDFCRAIQQRHGILLYPIRSPTVPRGQERVRIILHAHNTSQEVQTLVKVLVETLREMNLLQVNTSRL